jgi:hypothetical protein
MKILKVNDWDDYIYWNEDRMKWEAKTLGLEQLLQAQAELTRDELAGPYRKLINEMGVIESGTIEYPYTTKLSDITGVKEYYHRKQWEQHPCIECVCEFRPAKYHYTPFVFENDNEKVYLSQVSITYENLKHGSLTSYPVSDTPDRLARELSRYQKEGYTQIG